MGGTKQAVMVALCLWSAFAGISAAQTADNEEQEEQLARETLRGLPGVAVRIEDLAPEAEEDGLTKTQLRGDVEQILRQAEIRVLSEEERLNTSGHPTLSVHVGTYRARSTYGLCIEVALKQVVMLRRNPNLERLAETWETKGVGIGGRFRLQEVRQGVISKVGQFVAAYRAVNPGARQAVMEPLRQERRLEVTTE